MKRLLLLATAALTLFSCSKSGDSTTPEPETTPTTLLLKRVTETTGGTSTVNVEFTYNGKQVAKAGYFKRADGSFSSEQAFSYNAQGKLINVATNGTNGVIYTVNYFADDVSNIVRTYTSGVTQTYRLTFGNGKLVKTSMSLSNQSDTGESNYTYNAGGNNTNIEHISNSSFGQSKTIDEFASFDDKKSVMATLPVSIFYQTANPISGLDYFYGTNNPLTYKNTYRPGLVFNFTLNYTYNSSGYPTSLTIKQVGSSDQQRFTYDYIEVK